MLAQFTQIQEPIDTPQQVVTRDVIGQIECVEELILACLLSHHDVRLRQ